ncbi:CCR4-NOT transcription complex subunit 3 [Sporothrix brasiliensis 5110]|uniref:General negative regulator of transcription subunit n=1 Tax=Sporothrix brasiliensis 5110 TaxID=1398154 RepID=A0A0C2EL26_9PEZI|nr:CCR4-NOT transcription complex subunit 3 [Sporothrix brasiliensis 5110]KIH86779.1 CCR4-NOT transcription complex subunit 3 [Sporothrix brasiliensis 5110]
MAARKLQQEVDKCFKKVTEGVAEFDAIYEKIEQSNNPAQKEKLEDNLKREIKKLQRLRDQIKTWAAGNEIKDKGPLMEYRRLIETQMERFKAVEKAMKTKAYSKEGLSAATKLDPKEQAKVAKGEFIGNQVDELEQQIETLEAEGEAIQATTKRGKMHGAKAERMAQIERTIERHKWHQGKLELIRRSLENGGVDVDQVADLEESIRYYVTDNMQSDFIEDDTMYDDLNLEENEDAFGMNLDNDKVSSQDNQSIQGDTPEIESKPAAPPTAPAATGKGRQGVSEAAASGRRPSAQLKSPLPALATLHTPLPTLSNGSVASTMKPASIPTRPAGEVLKYASAAAAAAASDKLNLGISPLPPPVGVSGAVSSSQLPTAASIPAVQASKIASAANSPKPTPAQPSALSDKSYSPAVSVAAPASASTAPAAAPAKAENTRRSKNAAVAAAASAASAASAATPAPAEQTEATTRASSQTNGFTNGAKHGTEAAATDEQERRDEESIYHLPASLRDLVDSFEVTKSLPAVTNQATTLRQLSTSANNPPEAMDSEPPRRYVPDMRYNSTSNYPQEPLPLLDDPRLYNRIDPDTLFYVFYYKQGTYQQYLAAKALKDMSWRFHKQYQTWFQRHEEPKSITEEFEQGTYRFFDYESTWMNRRKADFKFVYKFLEDDV